MSNGQGQRYTKMFENEYYRQQWYMVERGLLLDLLHKEKARGATRYLDFACGTGRILKEGENLFPDSTGYDVSKSMLAECRKLCTRSKIECIDINEKEGRRKFDVITAFRFFLNAEMEMRKSVLRRLYEILDDDGTLIANIHTTPTSPTGMAYRMRAFLGGVDYPVLSLKGFKNILLECKFEVVHVDYYGYYPRTGNVLRGMARYLLLPVENIGRLTQPFSNKLAQGFIVVCKKSQSS